MSHRLVIKDAFRQIAGRVISALAGFLVIKLVTPYLGPLRFGDYSTILKYFAIRSALADFGLYVLALRELGTIKATNDQQALEYRYSQFVRSRFSTIAIVYTFALVLAYFLPAYTSNMYLVRGLPFGMVFSALFMGSSIVQLPLQLFWKMEKVSIGLIAARIAQLIVIVTLVRGLSQWITGQSLGGFLIVVLSVVVSGMAQMFVIYHQGKQYIRLQRVPYRSFLGSLLKKNRQYGLANFFSSFHTLIVLLLLSLLFPTIGGNTAVGIRALALSLIEILLIIPSSLANSMLHRIAHSSLIQKKHSFGSLLAIMIWIGGLFLVNFTLFHRHIIAFVSSSSFLSQPAIVLDTVITNMPTIVGQYIAGTQTIGSDFLLPFLGIVLLLSFMKQVYNYLFVSTETHNTLLWINGVAVICGGVAGVRLVYHYQLLGGILTQLLLEILFVGGAMIVSIKNRIMPVIPRLFVGGSIVYFILSIRWGYHYIVAMPLGSTRFLPVIVAYNGVTIGLWLYSLHRVTQGFVPSQE